MPSEDYLEVRLLGRGNYGEAWLVKSTKDKKKYVLKRVDLRCADEKERQAAEQEAQLLSQLKHPNIVAYKESFNTTAGFLCITMGFCEGGDLYHRLQLQNGVPLDERQIVEWFVQISMAIKYMHDKHILHRDLKTQNIFLTKSEIIKVGDLGIARVLESSNAMATTMIGTPYYMSPEIFSNKPYDYKSDIWALGCCVYEMMTLKHAFDAKSFNALAFRILQGKLPPMPVIYPTGLVNLVKATLKKNPEKRPTIERILGDPYIKKHITLFLEKTKTKQPFVNKNRRPEKPAESDVPTSHPRHGAKLSPPLVSKEMVSQSLETLHLGPDLRRIDEESTSSHRSIDGTVHAKDARSKIGAGGGDKLSSKDMLEGRDQDNAKKTRPGVRTDSPTLTAANVPSKNSSKRDKYNKKKMVEISTKWSKEMKKSDQSKPQLEEADKISAEGRMRTASDVGAKMPANGVKLVSDQRAKTASEISAQIGSSRDVVESVQFVGKNVLYCKDVQPNQCATPDENKIESASDSNFKKLGNVSDEASSAVKQKSSVSRRKSSDSTVSGQNKEINENGDNLQGSVSPRPHLRHRPIRKSSGDANIRASPVILESVSNNTNETVDNNRTKVERVEGDLKDNGSPKPKSRSRSAGKSRGDSNVPVHLVVPDSVLSNSSKVGDKTRQNVEDVGSDLKDNGSPRPKSRNKHSRKSSGDASTKTFPVVVKSPNASSEFSDKILQQTEGVEIKPSKSHLSESVQHNGSSSVASKNVVKQRVNVGRPLPPPPKVAGEPKETQFHHRRPMHPSHVTVSQSNGESSSSTSTTPVSTSSASSATSSKDEMNDHRGSMNSSSRRRRRKMKEKEGSYCAKSIDVQLQSSEDVVQLVVEDDSEDVVDAFVAQKNDRRPVSQSFDVFRNPLHHAAFWEEDNSSHPSETPPRSFRSGIEKGAIPVIDDMGSSSSESLEEVETVKPKGPRYKEIKSFISLLSSTLLLKAEKEQADVSDEDAESTAPVANHRALSVSKSDTPLFVKRSLPPSITNNANSFTAFHQTMTDSNDKPLYCRDDSNEYNGKSGRLFERIVALRLDCISGIGQFKLDEALRLINNFETQEFDMKLIGLLGEEHYAKYAGKIWQLKFCLENVAAGLR